MTHGISDIGARDPFSADAIAEKQQRLITSDSERTAVAAAAEHLSQHGYVILERVMTNTLLESCRRALDDINARTRRGLWEFEGLATHRAYCVVSQSRAFDELIMNRQVLAIIETYFGDTPQLSASMGMTLYEGQTAQPLHRDTGHFPIPWPRPPLEVNALWAFDDFTQATGATRFVPDSHRIPNETRPESPALNAVMPAGSVLLYDGSLWHGGGAATHQKSHRRSVNNIYVRQWLRQQDNLYLSMPPQTVLALPKLMQRLLGYWIYGYTLGVVDGGSPLAALEARRSSL